MERKICYFWATAEESITLDEAADNDYNILAH